MSGTPKTDGRLVENIAHFTQALRKAGVKVGTGQLETAIEAVAVAGFSHRVDFYHLLRATLVTRAQDLETFHQVFSMFWRDPDFLSNMIHTMSPRLQSEEPPPKHGAARRRAEEALSGGKQPEPEKERDEVIEYAAFTWSGKEVLKTKDFEQMTAAELAEAERAVRTLHLPAKPLRTRRAMPDVNGTRTDMRATLRRATRRAGEVDRIARKSVQTRAPDLVAICDISGSMATYSRMILRYLHALSHARSSEWRSVHAFTFGTELTNVTRALRIADPDHALSSIGQDATDWEGGTQIGAALARFNRDWTRRVLSRGAVVLLITDGLERGEPGVLEAEAARLGRTARHLIWLNPLLRYDGFAPLAGGVATLLKHVDSFHACHSLDSLDALTDALGTADLRDHFRRQIPHRSAAP